MTDTPQVINFGCRLNSYESEAMRDLADQAGLTNAIIINTCAVTAEAERQARQAIRRARRQNPDAKIIVTGCAVQVHPDKFAEMPEIDRLLSNDQKMKKESFLPGRNERVLINDIMSVRETASHLVQGFEGKVRAFIQVQNGCDHRCTFCIIPFGRGPSRSVPIGEIVTQVQQLTANHCQEVILTGVDLTSYGHDLPGQPNLGQMVRRLLKLVPDLPRLRLSSVDPQEIDQDLLDVLATEKRLMPHFHLSVQAGSDLTLKRMKRRHLRQDVIDICQKIRDIRPDAVFGADIIAGFPTETDEMFQETLDLLAQCNITYIHPFTYSARQGTPAAKMPQVPMPVRKQRTHQLQAFGQQQLTRFLQTRIGQIEDVLVEHGYTGHTPHHAVASVPAEIPAGQRIQFMVKDVQNNQLIGQVI